MLRRAQTVGASLCLTDNSHSALSWISSSSTAQILPSPPPNISLDPDSLSTKANPPASRFSQPRSDSAVSVSESWRHAARLRLFEKISTPHVCRARAAGTTFDLISSHIQVLTSIRSVLLDYEDPHHQHDTEGTTPRKIKNDVLRKLLTDVRALREEAAEILAHEAQTSRRIPGASVMRVTPTATASNR